MDIGGWTLVFWVAAIVAMLALLKFWLGRLCRLSCEDLSCVSHKTCEPRDV
jgi:hypothetical protein